jgi:hypothetical protein
MEPITISQTAETFVSFAIAMGVYILLLGIKAFFQWLPWPNGGVWTNRIPGWAWAVTACVVSVGVCIAFRVDQIGALLGQVIPMPWPVLSWAATGLAIGLSSNVLYKVLTPIGKKLKDARTGKVVCLPPGVALPAPTPAAVPSVQTVKEPPVPATPASPTVARLLIFCDEDPDVVLIDGADPMLVPVDREQPEWLTGPTASSPNHVLIPMGWNRTK